MCKKEVFSLLLTFALAQAGVFQIHQLDYLEGPSTKTKVIGPDGSIIDAYLPGGRIDLSRPNAPLIQTVPFVVAAPAVQHHSHAFRFKNVVAEEPVANTIEVHADPVTKSAAGSLPEFKSVTPQSQPSVEHSYYAEPKVLLHPGTPPRIETRESVPVTESTDENTETTDFITTEGTTVTPADVTDFFSGRYIHDNFEALYDDGSYRVEHY